MSAVKNFDGDTARAMLQGNWPLLQSLELAYNEWVDDITPLLARFTAGILKPKMGIEVAYTMKYPAQANVLWPKLNRLILTPSSGDSYTFPDGLWDLKDFDIDFDFSSVE